MAHYIWSTMALLTVLLWGPLGGQSGAQEVVLADFSKASGTLPADWELVINNGEAQFLFVTDTPGQVLQLRSDNASFALQKKIQLPLHTTPNLVWHWKVTKLPTGGDFRQRRTDDQAAQLIVAFSSTRFLSYIWDTTVPKGTTAEAPAPPFRKILAMVIQSGQHGLGTWMTEQRNLVEDYTRLFGEAPNSIEGVRIQINSQHTRSQAEAYWKSISLTGNRAAAAPEPGR